MVRRALLAVLPLALFVACGEDYDEAVSSDDAGAVDAQAFADASETHDGNAPVDAGEDVTRTAADAEADADAAPAAFAVAVGDVTLRDGETADVVITITRPSGNDAEVTVTLSNVPDLVTASSLEATIPSGVTTAKVTLSRQDGVLATDTTINVKATSAQNATPIEATTKFTLHVVAGGALDPAFGGGTGIKLLANASQATLGPDGSVYLVQTATSGCAVEKRKTSGDADTSFGKQGTAAAPDGIPPFVPLQAVVAPSGAILVAGHTAGDSRYIVVRFSAQGVFDATLAGKGYIEIPKGSSESYLHRAAAVSQAGLMYFAYQLRIDDDTVKPKLVRYLESGQPDPSWTDPTPAALEDYFVLAPALTTEAVVAGGSSQSQAVLAQFGATAYGPTVTDWGRGLSVPLGLTIKPGGESVFAVGYTSDTGTNKGAALAAAWYSSSLVVFSLEIVDKRVGIASSAPEALTSVTLDDAGRFVAAGYTDAKYLAVARFDKKGWFDPSFGAAGVALIGDREVSDVRVVVLPDRTIEVLAYAHGSDPGYRLYHLRP